MSIHILFIFAKNRKQNGQAGKCRINYNSCKRKVSGCVADLSEWKGMEIAMDSWSNVRTDLALEARESIGEKESGLHGLEAPAMTEPEEDYHQEISRILAEQLRGILPNPDEEQSILVVGLGNREVTADSLGPNVVDNLFVNRHIVMEYGKVAYNRTKMHLVSSLAPGVMAKTGMESAEIIKGVIGETKPDLVIAIDALAARSTKRLNRTIQITNTGIHPGSGVGNHRNAITEETCRRWWTRRRSWATPWERDPPPSRS